MSLESAAPSVSPTQVSTPEKSRDDSTSEGSSYSHNNIFSHTHTESPDIYNITTSGDVLNDNSDTTTGSADGSAAEADNSTASSDQDDDNNSADFSKQDKAVALMPKFSAFLSICGSSYIIYDVIGTGQAFHSTNHRLLMGMSACTLLVSLLAFFMSTWPIPADANVYLAAGNQATCDAQGFFSQFSLAVVMYNASLSAYYVAKVVHQCKTNFIHRILEPVLHTVPLTVGFGTALAGVSLDLYNPGGWECWIEKWPEDCEETWTTPEGETTCMRGDNASIYRWVFYYGILWLAIFFVLANMTMVYKAVYAQEKKMNQYNFQYRTEMERLEKERLQKILAQLNESDSDSGSDDVSVASNSSHLSYAASVASRSISRGLSSVHRVTRKSMRMIPNMVMKQQHASLRAHFVNSRRVSRQGYWFCGAFLATWLFPTLHRIVQLGWQTDLYPLHLLTAIFVPIQGFFNFLVYIQTRIKRKHIRNAFCFCLWFTKKNPLLANTLSNRRVMASSCDIACSDDSSSSSSDDDNADDNQQDQPSLSETLDLRIPTDSKGSDGLPASILNSSIDSDSDEDNSFDVEKSILLGDLFGEDDRADMGDSTKRASNNFARRPRISMGTSYRSSTARQRTSSGGTSMKKSYRSSLRKTLEASLNASIQRWHISNLNESHRSSSEMTSSAKSHYSPINGRLGDRSGRVSVERPIFMEDISESDEGDGSRPFEISFSTGLNGTTDDDDDDDDDLSSDSSSSDDDTNTLSREISASSEAEDDDKKGGDAEEKSELWFERANSVDRLVFVGDMDTTSSEDDD